MIYLDNSATTFSKPKEVIDAVVECLKNSGNSGRGNSEVSLKASRIIFETRENLAKLFNIKNSKQIAFTSNSTEALNIAIKGCFNLGEHIISTTLEHNSVLRPLYEIQDKGVNVSFVTADKNGNINYDDFTKLINSDTKAIICTHASNLTGNLLNLSIIGKICKKYNLLFIVDASQTAGVFPIDVEEMGIDILCFTGHKSLFGPQGIGGIYVRENLNIRPLKSGGTGIKTFSKTQPLEMPTLLESGTLNTPGIAGLNAGVKFIMEIGIENIKTHELSLMWKFYESLKELKDVKIYGDFSTRERAPIVTINIKDYSSEDVAEELLSTYNIVTRAGGHCAPLLHKDLGTEKNGAVRFSFGFFNTIDDVIYTVNAIKKIISENN